MNSKLNKKLSNFSSSITDQELAVKQLLLHNDISFVMHQKLHLNDRYYIIDFMINNSILLECSFTTMYRVGVALKQKSLQLERKYSQLKTTYPNQFWVLFESTKPISSQLLTTLKRLMPSVDQLLTSQKQLLEIYRILRASPQKSSQFNFANQLDFLKPKIKREEKSTLKSSFRNKGLKEHSNIFLRKLNKVQLFSSNNKYRNQDLYVFNSSPTYLNTAHNKSTEVKAQRRKI
ncbi:hypothetical protein CEE45_09055 [Candidatus Heimdallarchaeota archaeon B3_Heim]|nr:MAG: hypothetical protein CEE45_09055 [Candidatus Heimdallarchaeota archaeon B3_Heim]